MAEVIQLDGGGTAKIRSVWWVAILSVVTLGIYVFFWWYFINREMADYGRVKGTNELGDSPGKSVLAITLGALIIVPAILSIIHTFKRVQATQRLSRETAVINGWIGVLLLVVISPAFYAYMQSGLNSAWRAVAAAGTPEAPQVV
jgi:Domain of unknown function (DUF4234)